MRARQPWARQPFPRLQPRQTSLASAPSSNSRQMRGQADGMEAERARSLAESAFRIGNGALHASFSCRAREPCLGTHLGCYNATVIRLDPSLGHFRA